MIPRLPASATPDNDRATTHRPRKRFGQHFLHETRVLETIVAAIAPQRDDTIVEIGPGEGALTAQLLPHLERLHAIELDRDLVVRLQRQFGDAGLTLHTGDALSFDFRSLAAEAENAPLRVVGNLPYNISTPLIFHLLEHSASIRDMHFLLQKEVVDRITAQPGGKEWGRLGIMVQVHATTQNLFRVAPGAFRPPPKVQSAVVRITPRAEPLVPRNRLPGFATIVQRAFQQRRKTLGRSLRGTPAGDALRRVDMDPQRRPETVTLDEWLRLHRATGAAHATPQPEVATSRRPKGQ